MGTNVKIFFAEQSIVDKSQYPDNAPDSRFIAINLRFTLLICMSNCLYAEIIIYGCIYQNFLAVRIIANTIEVVIFKK